MSFNRCVWIVTKDIRLEDNLTLFLSLNQSNIVFPVFVMDEEQITKGGKNSVRFLFESLTELDNELTKLSSMLHVVSRTHFREFIINNRIDVGFILKAFTQFEKQRYTEYSSFLNIVDIDDNLGCPRAKFLKKDGKPYVVFSYFEKNFMSNGGLELPNLALPPNIHKISKIDSYPKYDFISKYPVKSSESTWIGGLTEGKNICMIRYSNLNSAVKTPEKEISPHLKFGTVSPRLVFHCGGQRGVLWRALYYILMDNDIVYVKQRNVTWNNDVLPEATWHPIFKTWVNGNTGYDFVDAAIHQLVRTGTMDNEVRMLVANFLVFVLGINWRYGEEFFRLNLVDYDWALNIGNWAWSAQIGIDNPSPNRAYEGKPIRVFNPETYKTKTKEEKEYRANFISKWLGRPQNSIPKVVDFKTAVTYNLQFY